MCVTILDDSEYVHTHHTGKLAIFVYGVAVQCCLCLVWSSMSFHVTTTNHKYIKLTSLHVTNDDYEKCRNWASGSLHALQEKANFMSVFNNRLCSARAADL